MNYPNVLTIETGKGEIMSVVDDLKAQITAGRIGFDPSAEPDKFKKELLNENTGTQVTAKLQNLVLAVSKVEVIKISSIIRDSGHHSSGRAFDVGNESVAKSLLGQLATDAKVRELEIDEIIFDAKVAGETDRNKWNYDQGKKHVYDSTTLDQHKNHIHFAVTAG